MDNYFYCSLLGVSRVLLESLFNFWLQIVLTKDLGDCKSKISSGMTVDSWRGYLVPNERQSVVFDNANNIVRVDDGS